MSLDVLQGLPIVEILPSGLKRITRIRKLRGDGVKAENIGTYALAYGTADVEYPNAFLTDQRCEPRSEQSAEARLIQVYQELADNALTATNEVVETTTFDGRRVTRSTYLCKAAQAAALKPAIGSGSPAVFQVENQSRGPVATIAVFALELTALGFVLSDTTDTRNLGKLQVRTIRTVGQVAATPEGFSAISSGTNVADGYTVYNGVFAKGAGRVSTEVSYKQNGKLKITTVRYLETDDGAGETGALVIDESRSDDGYTVYIKGYAEIVGDGVVRDDTENRSNGKLVVYHRVRLAAAPETPFPTIGGVVVLVEAGTRQEDGFTLYDYRWAEGKGRISLKTQTRYSGALTLATVRYLWTDDGEAPAGVLVDVDSDEQDGVTLWTKVYANGSGTISETIHARQDGLREVTRVSLGLRSAPDGVVIRDDYQKEDGYNLYTVTAIQGASGGAVTSATVTFERYVPFVYPGRAKIFTEVVDGGWRMYDLFRSPPVKTDVKAEISVTYQTTPAIGTVANYWNPKEWAWVKAEWVGLNNNPGNLFAALPGYRADPADSAGWEASIWAGDVAGCMMGNVVYGGTTARIEVGGGPDDPGGTTKTLDVTIEPAFQATDGTTYYRKTVVTADIPAQADLPI